MPFARGQFVQQSCDVCPDVGQLLPLTAQATGQGLYCVAYAVVTLTFL